MNYEDLPSYNNGIIDTISDINKENNYKTILNKSATDFIWNAGPNKVFVGQNYFNVENISKLIYNNYTKINNVITRFVEVACGIAWDTQTTFKKMCVGNSATITNLLKEAGIKSDNKDFSNINYWMQRERLYANSEIKKEIIDADKEADDVEMTSSETLFEDFYYIMKRNDPNMDIPALIDYDNYIRSVELLRNEIMSNNIYDFILFDIEKCPEYFELSNKENYWSLVNNRVTYAFKVYPYLVNGSVMENLNNGDIPVIKYKVALDIYRLVTYIFNFTSISNLKDADKEAEFDKEKYISMILGKLMPTIEILTRTICLEIFEMNNNISLNLDKFHTKIRNEYTKLANDEEFKNLNNKFNYIFKRESISIDSHFIDQIDKIFNATFYNPTNNFHSNIPYIDIYNVLMSNDENLMDNLLLVLYKNTFTYYYSNTVSLHFSRYNSMKLESYCREFERKYDINHLYEVICGISDYNNRDFFLSILNDFKDINIRNFGTTLPNGEKRDFLFSKFKRECWLSTFVSLLPLVRIHKIYKNIINTKVELQSEELIIKLNKSLKDFIELIFEFIIINISASNGMPSKPLHKYHRLQTDNKYIMKIYQKINYISDYIFNDNYKSENSAISKLFDIIENYNKSNNGLDNYSLFLDYDAATLSKNTNRYSDKYTIDKIFNDQVIPQIDRIL